MGVQPNQSTYDDPPPGSSDRKRKRRHTAAPSPTNVSPAALLRDEDDDEASDRVVRNAKKPKKPKKASIAAPAAEKRLRRFRPSAPSSFHAVYERATSQRFFLLSRTRCGTPDCPEELFELTGSTGNVYRVHIQKQPTCSCPHASAGNQCKHIVWALKSVLRAPYALVFQLALLSTELRDIFANAPAPADESGAGPDKDKNRKPVDGDCPICFEEMQSGDGKEPLVWCRAACGQNIHRQCFEMWAATKKTGNGTGTSGVPCPYCRSAWETDNDMKLKNIITSGAPNADGYVNVADQLGISTERDCSTYSTWWTGHSGYRGRR